MREPLTRRQREVFDFVASHIERRGYAPSLAEIGANFGTTSLSTTHKHLENLKAKGWITRRWNESRYTRIVADGPLCPTCGQATPTVDERLIP